MIIDILMKYMRNKEAIIDKLSGKNGVQSVLLESISRNFCYCDAYAADCRFGG
jgi:hypothetical protein